MPDGLEERLVRFDYYLDMAANLLRRKAVDALVMLEANGYDNPADVLQEIKEALRA